MCGRFTLTQPGEALRHFQLKDIYLVPRYNIAPNGPIPLIRVPARLEFLQWGFIPHWQKDSQPRPMINARVETVSEKPFFKEAFRKRRCLIVADGYYEWATGTTGKQPYYIQRTDKKVFAFAGIWSNDTCAILTTAALSPLTTIHDRMPVIIHEMNYDRWLDPKSSLENLLQMTVFNTDALEIFPVRTIVNNPSIDNAECIQPLSLKNT